MKYHLYIEESTVYHAVVDQDGEFNADEAIKEGIKKINQRNCARVGRSILKPLEIYEESSKQQVWSK